MFIGIGVDDWYLNFIFLVASFAIRSRKCYEIWFVILLSLSGIDNVNIASINICLAEIDFLTQMLCGRLCTEDIFK